MLKEESSMAKHIPLSSAKPENAETKTKVGQSYKSNHYVIIHNSELGQLKEASLDSFPPPFRLRTMPKPGIHFNIQSIRGCARPLRSQKCATNTFTRSIFIKKNIEDSHTIVFWREGTKEKNRETEIQRGDFVSIFCAKQGPNS